MEEFFNWRISRRRYNEIEAFDMEVSQEHKDCIQPVTEHGTQGPLKLSYPEVLERGVTKINAAMIQCGVNRNHDVNSGDPIGLGIITATGSKGTRSTALCYLEHPSSNLTITADSPVSQIVFHGKGAVSVRLG